MTKDKLYLVISFLVNLCIALAVYSVKVDMASIRREISHTRELLEEKINNVKPRLANQEEKGV